MDCLPGLGRFEKRLVEVGLVRSSPSQARMWPSAVVEIQISADQCAGLADGLVGPQIDLLVFDRFPEPLDEYVVAPGAPAIHADLDLLREKHLREVDTGELTALVGVEDLGLSEAAQRLFQGLDAEICFLDSRSHFEDRRGPASNRTRESC